MDFLTQNLLGAVAGHAALGRPRRDGGLGRLSLLAGALGGAVPDFDFLLKPFADPALPMEFHRHFTHALVFIPAGGLIAALPLLLLRRGRAEFRRIYAAATIGCATHGLLDNLTSYGTHLLWPFTQARTAWDSMSIVDPLFTGLLLLAVIVALVRGQPRATRVGLTLALAYIGFGFVQHARAASVQRALAEERGHVIENGRVHPTVFNIVVFRSVYESEGQLWADAIRVGPLGGEGVREGTSIPRFRERDLPPDTSDRTREVFRGMDTFAAGFLGSFDAPDTDDLILGDMRISMSTTEFLPMWGIAIDGDGHPRAWDSFHANDERARNVLRAIRDDVLWPEGRFRTLGRADDCAR